MFSLKQKQFIAAEIEKLLLSLNHPEMPTSKPNFTLHVDGKEEWSWADIKPNWIYEGESQQPSINPFNEMIANQTPVPPDIQKIVNENFMSLITKDSDLKEKK